MFHHYSIACIFSADMVENVQTDFRTQVSNLFPILKYPEQSRYNRNIMTTLKIYEHKCVNLPKDKKSKKPTVFYDKMCLVTQVRICPKTKRAKKNKSENAS